MINVAINPPYRRKILSWSPGAELHPSLLLHVQYSMKILYVPVLIRQNLSSPCIPGSPMYAQLRKYLHSPLTEKQNNLF